MLLTTNAIVLGGIKYSDHSHIVNVYTEVEGKLSIMAKGSKKKSPLQNGLAFPLSIVEVVIDYNPKKSIHPLKNCSIGKVLMTIHTDYTKSALTMFIAEVIQRSFSESHQDVGLFNFLKNQIIVFDNITDHIANYHISFLLEYSKHLGFYPNKDEIQLGTLYFNLDEGNFCTTPPFNSNYIDSEAAALLYNLVSLSIEEVLIYPFSKEQRNILIEALLRYYSLHIPHFGTLKSYETLKECFA